MWGKKAGSFGCEMGEEWDDKKTEKNLHACQTAES